VWSKGMCQNHIKKKPLKVKKQFTFSSNKQGSIKMRRAMKQMLFFHKIWMKRPHKSEISGDKLYGEPSSAYFHHILPKGKFPLAAEDEENIIILTMDEHANVESDMYKYEEINDRRKLLLKKYNLI
jgi:hypothetical protein